MHNMPNVQDVASQRAQRSVLQRCRYNVAARCFVNVPVQLPDFFETAYRAVYRLKQAPCRRRAQRLALRPFACRLGPAGITKSRSMIVSHTGKIKNAHDTCRNRTGAVRSLRQMSESQVLTTRPRRPTLFFDGALPSCLFLALYDLLIHSHLCNLFLTYLLGRANSVLYCG